MTIPSVIHLVSSIAFFLTTIVTEAKGVKIHSVEVPTIVRNGSDPIILDCIYSVVLEDPVAEGLIIKWYSDASPSPIYQWIVGDPPQAAGVFNGRANLDYKASEDPTQMYRAVQIVTPTTDLTGSYKCHVTTFEGEDTSALKKMTVYVPEREMALYAARDERPENVIKIVCAADGLFPEPNMTISSRERLTEEDNVKVNIETSNKEGLYEISATMELNDRGDGNSITFDCVLRVPDANYTVQKSIVYYPNTGSSSCLQATTSLLVVISMLLSTWL